MASLTQAYLRGEAGAFYAGHPRDAASRRRAVERARRPLAPAVAEALAAQDARLPASASRSTGVEALRRGAAAVVTGQQVGLFLGPLYTLYKAASAIRWARLLAAETGAPVVPVFWLQTEDHDLAEIAQTAVPSSDGPRTLALPASDARVSIAHLALPAAVTDALAELADELAGRPHAGAHLARLARHYRPGATWAGAFAGVLAELFAPHGLVIVDPRDPALVRAAAPLHARALLHAEPIAAALAARAAALTAAGHDVPIHVRPGAPLAFYHPDGPAGPRFRLAPTGDGRLAEVGGARTHAPADLLAALEVDPARFSTSALLRPALQDTLLPTAAYVGGPAEVAYLAQVAPLHAHLGLPEPLVVHRARFRLVDAPTRRALARLGVTAAEVEGRTDDELRARGLASPPGAPSPAELSARLLGPLAATLDELGPVVADAGVDLPRALGRTRATVTRAVERLAGRYGRALARRDGELAAVLGRVRTALAPDGAPQERIYGPAAFAARTGDETLVELVLAAIDPLDPSPRDLAT